MISNISVFGLFFSSSFSSWVSLLVLSLLFSSRCFSLCLFSSLFWLSVSFLSISLLVKKLSWWWLKNVESWAGLVYSDEEDDSESSEDILNPNQDRIGTTIGIAGYS